MVLFKSGNIRKRAANERDKFASIGKRNTRSKNIDDSIVWTAPGSSPPLSRKENKRFAY
jgi:hypothetical protein